MQPRHELPPDAVALIRAQHGVVTVPQLHRMGLTRHSVQRAARSWTRLARGVYLTTALQPDPPWMSLVWAGVLLGGRSACASGPTAAVLDGLVTLEEVRRGAAYLPRAVQRASHEIHVSVPSRRVRDRPGFVFTVDERGSHLPGSDVPPRTHILDTVLDLCADGPEKDVPTWVGRACQRRLTTPRLIQMRLQDRPLTTHAALIRDIVKDVTEGATTELERRALRDIFDAHGLPHGTPQARINGGGRIVDFLLDEFGLVVEFDGKVGHVEEGALRDRRRDNTHTVGGLTTLRYGWQETIGAPCECAVEVAVMLRRRGWAGLVRRCPRCRPALPAT